MIYEKFYGNGSDTKAGAIFVTEDYDKFKKLESNRDVRGVKKILNSIDAVGYVLSPILVNEKYEVIDGQHRIEAFKKKGLPVYYVMQEGAGIEECQNLNTGQSNWTTLDFIESYADQGDENYKRLLSLYWEFGKDYRLEGVMAFAIGYTGRGGGGHIWIKEKRLSLSEEQYEMARKRMKSAKDLGFVDLQRLNKFYIRSWYAAVSYAYRHQEVSEKELAQRLKDSPLELASYNKVEDQLAVFDKIYNKGRSKKKVFMASDFQLNKYPN